MKKPFKIVLPLTLIAIVTGLIVYVWVSRSLDRFVNTESTSQASATPSNLVVVTPESPVAPAPTSQTATIKIIKAAAIAGAASQYQWQSTVPSTWSAESVASIEAINLYDPTAEGTNNLEKSQIFIRYFSANQFLTLQTVTIHSKIDLTVNSRPAVRYDIEKKSSVANFGNQPLWRSQRHIVTDVRVSDTNPSVFYVIAKRPDLDQAVYDQFLADFQVKAE